MKTTEFKKADGTTGKKYQLEIGDVVYPIFDSVGESEQRAGVNKETQKPFITQDFYLKVKLDPSENDDLAILLSLSKGQANALKKAEPLMGKKITGREYENKFGKFVGVKVEPVIAK